MEHQLSPARLQRRINRLAERQYGAVSRSQLLRLGLGAEAIQHRLAAGRLSLLHRGVYAVGPGPGTRERRWAAAVLACGEGAVLSHLSAAALWGLRAVDPAVIDVSVATRNRRCRDGLRIHRPRHLDPADTTHHRAIPVTAIPRTLIDLAEMVSRRSLERALDEAEFLGLLVGVQVEQALERHRGRAGAARLAACLRRHEPGTTRTKSPLEEAFLALVREVGLAQPEVNVRLGPYEIDFLWREQRLAVETDAGASHDRAAARERDAARDAWLAAADYESLRFTWHQVTERPGEVVAAVEAKLVVRP
jgi:very-short-patch-repair endonuclease/predicted transcriptional regulator of viral defense system